MLNWVVLYAFLTSFALCFLLHRRPSGEPPVGFLKFKVRVLVLLAFLVVGALRGDSGVWGSPYESWWSTHTASYVWAIVVPPVTLMFWALKTITFQVSANPRRYAAWGPPPGSHLSMGLPCFWNAAFWMWFFGPWLPFGQCWGQKFLRELVSKW